MKYQKNHPNNNQMNQPMKTRKKSLSLMSALALAGILTLAGCTSTSQATTETVTSPVVIEATTNEGTATTTTITNAQLQQLLTEKIEYDEKDDYTDWTKEAYTSVSFSGNSGSVTGSGAALTNGVLTITQAGTYVLSGNFTGSVLVNVPKEDNVRLVLNGVTIDSAKTAPIQVYQANKVLLSLEEGTTNTVSDSAYGTATNADGDEITAAIYSKEDLIINGSGTLVVNGKNNDGITSRDDLLIISGNITVTAVDDGLVGKDSVQIKDGQITVNATGDGIKASNDTDEGEGYLLINGGKITVASGDDAIKGEQQLIVTGGTIDVTESVEGMESMDIIIAGGDIKIKSSDDGINAAGKDTGNTLDIQGGNIYVNAEGDGIDVNGSITMSDGMVMVDGPTQRGNGAMDYDQTFNLTGGTLILADSGGMSMAPSATSTVGSISMNYDSVQTAGTAVSIKDASGKVIAEATPGKNFQNVVFSSKDIVVGQTYSIYSGTTKIVDITPTALVTYANTSGITQGNPGRGMKGGGGGGGMPPGGFGTQQPPTTPPAN